MFIMRVSVSGFIREFILQCCAIEMTMFIAMVEFFLDAKFTLSLCRNLRQRDATKYHIQLCIALFCMLIVFVSGIDQTADPWCFGHQSPNSWFMCTFAIVIIGIALLCHMNQSFHLVQTLT